MWNFNLFEVFSFLFLSFTSCTLTDIPCWTNTSYSIVGWWNASSGESHLIHATIVLWPCWDLQYDLLRQPNWYTCSLIPLDNYCREMLTRPATIHRCTGTSLYFLPRYEYRIYIEQAIAIFTIHLHINVCIDNKHGEALSSISAHPPSAF